MSFFVLKNITHKGCHKSLQFFSPKKARKQLALFLNTVISFFKNPFPNTNTNMPAFPQYCPRWSGLIFAGLFLFTNINVRHQRTKFAFCNFGKISFAIPASCHNFILTKSFPTQFPMET